MSMNDTLKEAGRVMAVCNACRYCEGYCAVFPAMGLRRVLSDPDLKYLSNLCHNCRACYYACQYAPPHEFALNVSKALAELRLETYGEFSHPRFLAGVFKKNGRITSIVTGLSIIFLFLLALAFRNGSVLFSSHTGENAFYQIIPYPLIVVPMSMLGLWVLIVLFMGVIRFWNETGESMGRLLDPKANGQAIQDVLRLKYLDGYGHGCTYPNDRFRHTRRRFHHLIFYGFFLCFVSTLVAATYDHVLHLPPPYPLLSLPVILGTIGGLALLAGTTGSFYLKLRMDRAPSTPRSFSMDIEFLALLFLTSLTGLLLLLLRETPAMGSLLIIHLGIVIALFIMMPYGKFVHGVYRYAALVRNAVEQSEEEGS